MCCTLCSALHSFPASGEGFDLWISWRPYGDHRFHLLFSLSLPPSPSRSTPPSLLPLLLSSVFATGLQSIHTRAHTPQSADTSMCASGYLGMPFPLLARCSECLCVAPTGDPQPFTLMYEAINHRAGQPRAGGRAARGAERGDGRLPEGGPGAGGGGGGGQRRTADRARPRPPPLDGRPAAARLVVYVCVCPSGLVTCLIRLVRVDVSFEA